MAIPTWPLFIRQCLLKRASGEEFQRLANLLIVRSPASRVIISQALLDCRDRFCITGDPLVVDYLRAILISKVASPSDVIATMIRRWNKSSISADASLIEINDTAFVNTITELIASTKVTLLPRETRKIMVLTARWLNAVAPWAAQDSSKRTINMIEALGILLATTTSTERGDASLKNEKNIQNAPTSEPRYSVQKALEYCLPLISSTSSQLFDRLDALQKHFDLFDESFASTSKDLDAITFDSSIREIEIPPSGAALFVFIDAKLRNSTTIDDTVLLNFLNTRHHGNHQSMFSELVLSSFHVLANWVARNEAEAALEKCFQFIVNKVPSLLALITGSSFGSFDSESALVSMVAEIESFSPISTKIHHRFLHVCVLQHLVTYSALRVSGTEIPAETLSRELYEKDEVALQMKSNVQKAAQLIAELPRHEGNSGIIAQALVEVVHSHCLNRETAALKDFSHTIVQSPDVIDVIALFVRPVSLLSPLCALLDAWKWNDLHGESQPVYDEFGSILLLVQAFRYRLNLQISDLGISRTSTFMAQFVDQKNTEANLENLTEGMQRHLGEWINAFFIAEGLSDELTSSCSPQEFYLLTPTLLNQSMLALEAGRLAWETLRSRFDYLLEQFLLPSLIPALLWLSSQARRFHSPEIIISVLEVLMKSPENTEAKVMHRAILDITTEPLRLFLEDEALKFPRAKVLLAQLGASSRFASTIKTNDVEIRSWSTLPGGTIGTIQQSIQTLLTLNSSERPPLFNYLLLEYSIRLCGKQAVLKVLLQELQRFTGRSRGIGLDIIAAMVCSSTKFSLHNSLRLMYSRLGEVLRQDRALAEEVVRLHRRVESLGMFQTEPDFPLGASLADLNLQNITTTENPDIDMSTMTVIQDQPADIDAVLEAADAAAAMEEMDQTNVGDMDDVFGDLDGGPGLYDFGDLDMDGMF